VSYARDIGGKLFENRLPLKLQVAGYIVMIDGAGRVDREGGVTAPGQQVVGDDSRAKGGLAAPNCK
jgi:hypothetical protein